MSPIWISAVGLCGATLIGAILGFGIKQLPHKWNDTILGYCAGVMLGASTLGLIVPAFSMAADSFWWIVAIGVMAGALFLNVLDLLTPHLHHITGLEEEEHRNNKTLNHVMLFVMAIALHKLPEGIAAGVSMSTAQVDWSVSFGIALQNVPEGMVIIAPLLVAGVTRLRTMMISVVIGLLEIMGVWTGFALGSASQTFLPVMLGFAGGAMLYVTSDEMIPETHTHGYQKQATYALILGFMTLLLMEKMM
jgi:ZIP family zinc transporter